MKVYMVTNDPSLDCAHDQPVGLWATLAMAEVQAREYSGSHVNGVSIWEWEVGTPVEARRQVGPEGAA